MFQIWERLKDEVYEWLIHKDSVFYIRTVVCVRISLAVALNAAFRISSYTQKYEFLASIKVALLLIVNAKIRKILMEVMRYTKAFQASISYFIRACS